MVQEHTHVFSLLPEKNIFIQAFCIISTLEKRYSMHFCLYSKLLTLLLTLSSSFIFVMLSLNLCSEQQHVQTLLNENNYQLSFVQYCQKRTALRKKMYCLHLERRDKHFLNSLTRNRDFQDARIR